MAAGKKGFQNMPKDVLRELARKGGIAAHQAGSAHEYTSEEARVAGAKGGKATKAKRGSSPKAKAPAKVRTTRSKNPTKGADLVPASLEGMLAALEGDAPAPSSDVQGDSTPNDDKHGCC